MNNSNIKYRNIFIILAFFLILPILIVGYYFYAKNLNFKKNSSKSEAISKMSIITDTNSYKVSFPSPSNNALFISNQSENKIIAKVGEENIYGADLNYQIKKYLGKDSSSKNVRQQLMEKIFLDSIILQQAYKDKVIANLEAEIFNNPNKNYDKRFARINAIQGSINTKMTTNIKGSIIMIYFYNMQLWDIPYAQAKSIANKKINEIYKKISNNEISMEQAGELLKQDEDLFSIDHAWKTNVFFAFDVQKPNKITVFDGFDEILWNTKENSLTPIYLGKDRNPGKDVSINGKPVDAAYMFGKIYKKNLNGDYTNYNEWIYEGSKNYEIKYY